jgi:hypothetical protein
MGELIDGAMQQAPHPPRQAAADAGVEPSRRCGGDGWFIYFDY